MILDIGGGRSPQGVNLDPEHGDGAFRRRAQDVPWPIDAGAVTKIVASHVLEHIPAGPDRIAVFNEAHRVLAPGGKFEIVVPLVGYSDKRTRRRTSVDGWWAYADPTHVSFWWFPESLYYFTGGIEPDAEYGIERWQLTDWQVVNGWEGHATLVKP